MIDIESLSFVPIDKADNLPEVSGVYFVIAPSGSSPVVYVGQSVNIRRRWQSHHRQCEAESLGAKIIAYMPTKRDQLRAMESQAISQFCPPLNGQQMKKPASGTPIRVITESLDFNSGRWIAALISLSKAERGRTLGEFCQGCGITYRFLYQVVDGRSAISGESLAALKSMAVTTGAATHIESKLLAEQLGLTDH